MRYHNNNHQTPEQIDELLHSILDGSTEYAIIATDLENNIILWNRGAELIYGYSPSDMIGKQIPLALLHKNTVLDDDVLFPDTTIFHSRTVDHRLIAVRKNGSIVPVSVTVTPRISKGNAVGYLIIVRDITKLKLEEQFRNVLIDITHLVNSSNDVTKMCDSIVDSISDYIEVPIVFICIFNNSSNAFSIVSQTGLCKNCDSHHCIYTLNESCVPSEKSACFTTYSQLSINSENLLSHSISDYVSVKGLDLDSQSIIHVPLLSDVALIGLIHIVVPTYRKHLLLGETQILGLIANELAAGIQRKKLERENVQYSENLERMVATRTDELRQKDAQLVQSGKLATLGEMATGIAHEINQPLGAINLMAQGLILAIKKNKCSNELLNDKLSSIVEQIDRISKIIAHLRTFARQSTNIKQATSVNNPTEDVFKLMGEQLKTRNISVILNLSENLPPVLADHNKIEQVLLNILGNARDALDEFENEIKSLDNLSNAPDWLKQWTKKISVRTYLEDNYVCISVVDNASGINPKIIDKIFEPFFTTKEVGKGTGLGLSISYGIIKEFDGTIEVVSEIMQGSTFTVKIPVYTLPSK